ncbi:hypothetical protein FHX52_3881 [Humibacillus xanthopallidus]|uniref:Uncharacterized protein n=2 Tax=Humibacillus xanthopallidus TaxID=412689 RepID=A0A543PKR3_9MICO|nr:hypothetical protein FHX52_3881 [Humibacillus xanthopallidus]
MEPYFSAVAELLTNAGIPTMNAESMRIYTTELIADVIAFAPAMRNRISIDDIRAATTDDLQEHARERLFLHRDPLPAEMVAEDDLPGRALDFARDHPTLGIHCLLTWLPAKQLAQQFSGLVDWMSTREPDRLQLALVAAGKDSASAPCARICVIDDLEPGPFVRAMRQNTVVLTTASALMMSPPQTDFDAVSPLVVLVDGPVLPRILSSHAGRVGLMWDVYEVQGDRHLYVIVARLTVLTQYVWATITGEAGRSYLKAWLESLDDSEARRLPAAFSEYRAHLDVVIRHVIETWWFLGQESESLFDVLGS